MSLPRASGPRAAGTEGGGGTTALPTFPPATEDETPEARCAASGRGGAGATTWFSAILICPNVCGTTACKLGGGEMTAVAGACMERAGEPTFSVGAGATTCWGKPGAV